MSGEELLLSSPTPLVRRRVEEGLAAERAARRDEARRCFEDALRALGPSDDPSAVGMLLRWIGRTHADGGDPDAALDCFETALAVAEAAEDRAGVAAAINCRASVMFSRGRLDEAERLWRWTRRITRTYGHRELGAMVDQNLGNVASVRGDLEVALTQYRSALHTYRAMEMVEYVGPLLNNLGMTLTDLGRSEEAEAALAEGERVCRDSGNVSIGILLRVTRARLHVELGNWETARACCEAAQELAARADDERWLGDIYRYYGAALRGMGRTARSRRYLERARRWAVENEDLLLEAETAKEQADLHRVRGENRETLQALNRSHRLFSELRARLRLADVDRRLRSLEEDFLRIVQDWGESIESKDRYTQGHCERVAEYACALANAVGFPEEFRIWFSMGALLHDVGKVAIPVELLNKQGTLDEREWETMKAHPEEGVRLLGDVEFPWDVRPMVRHHHERWDGLGYPCGIAGEEIPLAARILTVADVFDALTTDRAYRRAFSPEQALGILEEESGTTFDPELASLFASLVKEGSFDLPGRTASDAGPNGPVETEPQPVGARAAPVESAAGAVA